MKLSKASIVLIVVGVLLIIIFPVWRWGIAPALIKIPLDIDNLDVYEGTLKMYADPEKFEIYPEGQEINIPVKVTRRTFSLPEKSTSKVAVMKEEVKATDRDGKEVLAYEHIYAMDRKTSENVPGHDSDAERDGYYIMFPFGSEKKAYPTWDNDLGKTMDSDFIKEVENKVVKLYVYGGSYENEKMIAPPIGIPAKLTGAQIKQIMGDPNLPLPDEQEFPLDFFKSLSGEIYVEPSTGIIVDVRDVKETYLVNAALPGQPPDYLKLSELDYSQTEDSVAQSIDFAKDNMGLIRLAKFWLPIIFLAVGLFVLLVGLLLARPKGGAKSD